METVAATNRMTQFFPEETYVCPEPPTGERERVAYWDDTFFRALAELRALLSSPKEAVRARAGPSGTLQSTFFLITS